MTTSDLRTQSLRALRLRALAPRMLLYGLVAILSLAGVRSILTPRQVQRSPAPKHVTSTGPDFAAITFAQAFARAYLTWSAADPTARQQALAPYLSQTMDTAGGLTPGNGTSESVAWTSVAGDTSVNGRIDVTIAAQTNHGLLYLNVPVAQDSSGSLAIDAYPALIGPPPTDPSLATTVQPPVQDQALAAVIERALANYLSGASTNLAADLAPGAVASVPERSLRLQAMDELTWIRQGSEVLAQLTATDSSGDTWTLDYQVGVVELQGRSYVRSIQVDPTSEGAT
jgi:hypothetical protein